MRTVIIRRAKKMAILNNEIFSQSLRQSKSTGGIFELQSSGQINSAALLGTRNELIIQHLGEQYILRQTRAGKLILTK